MSRAVVVRLPVLEVDHAHELAARQHRHRQKRLVAILRQFVERLEAWIVERMAAHGHRRPVLGHPAGDALTDPQLQPIDDIGMRRLRRAQHQVVVFQHVDEARIALDDLDTKSTTRDSTACSGSAAAMRLPIS